MRLIDAEALTDEIMERYCKECDKRKGIKNGKYRIIYEVGDAPCRACPIDDMKDELENVPTIEPERKTGHWEFDWRHDKATCSECGHIFRCVFDIDNFDNFCRHCGAKMEDSR